MATASQDTYKFQSKTQKVLKIIINSLYQNKEVFLRELISNASDALNKVRLKSLTSEKILDKDVELSIELIPDEENNTLTIKDTGIGMTKQDLIDNLGTIAKSGTEDFLAEIEKGDSESLIGQFGVGFYSAFLVADEVTVLTRSFRPNAKGYKWVSIGEEEFKIETTDKKDRGTEIILKLKEDFKEYTKDYELKTLIKKYSNYVEFPISCGEDKLNEMTALWRVSPSEVDDEQYKDFFSHLGQFGDPKVRLHVKADTPIEFYSILYVPGARPRQMVSEKDWGLKLYNRKILVEENNKNLLPEYLRFVIGVVDAEDLELNVSREVLQNTRLQKQINNYLHKKVLAELESLAKDDEEKYIDFFDEFGSYLKEGIAQNEKHKEKLTDLIRFNSTNENTAKPTVSLAQYLERMKIGQEEIYYLSGLDLDLLRKSPHLEYYTKEGFEVLLLGEPIDSFLMMHLQEYQEKKFFLIDQDESLDDTDDKAEEETEGEDETKKEKTGPHAPLLNKFVDVLGAKVTDVKVSERLVDSVARLVTPKGGISSDLQRAMKIMESNQGSPNINLPMMGKLLQINPDNDIIKALSDVIDSDSDNEIIPILIEQIHDNARLIDGDAPNFLTMMPRLEKIMLQSITK